MTDEQRDEEGAEEAIEDLEAPAAALGDVAGGKAPPKLPNPPPTYCRFPSETPKCPTKATCQVTIVVS